VADEASKNSRGPFDLRLIKNLVALMSQHDLSEIDLREGELRIQLRRGPLGAAAAPVVIPTVAPVSAATPAPPAAPAVQPEADTPAKVHYLIKSPTPGTFYARPEPKAEPYVRVGARVAPDTVVCKIEAMKIFNEIPAECTGVITEILVENEQPVEYGQALFKVNTT
jgi:acetyl-CoA carboxylase biotin carboxyl carrier protein